MSSATVAAEVRAPTHSLSPVFHPPPAFTRSPSLSFTPHSRSLPFTPPSPSHRPLPSTQFTGESPLRGARGRLHLLRGLARGGAAGARTNRLRRRPSASPLRIWLASIHVGGAPTAPFHTARFHTAPLHSPSPPFTAPLLRTALLLAAQPLPFTAPPPLPSTQFTGGPRRPRRPLLVCASQRDRRGAPLRAERGAPPDCLLIASWLPLDFAS